MKVKAPLAGAEVGIVGGKTPARHYHICWDPKDGDLCLNRAKPEETLVEARSDTDVQIVRLIWV
jgi:hypothetical protein